MGKCGADFESSLEIWSFTLDREWIWDLTDDHVDCISLRWIQVFWIVSVARAFLILSQWLSRVYELFWRFWTILLQGNLEPSVEIWLRQESLCFLGLSFEASPTFLGGKIQSLTMVFASKRGFSQRRFLICFSLPAMAISSILKS